MEKATWEKLLIPRQLIERGIKCDYVCYIDSDVLINPFAPNIYNWGILDKVGVVSVRNNLPFSFSEITKILAYLRREFIDNTCRLDTSQHFSTEQLYRFHSFSDQGDEFCAGGLLFSPSHVATSLEEWLFLYRSDVKNITDGGDQTQ